ncbi:DM13 domain-containing protein [Wenyingzhuangia sp. IMCC45533]
MKKIKNIIIMVSALSLFSCVEDEIVFKDKEDIISFDRALRSVAQDETPQIKVNIIKRVDGSDNSDAYNVVFESSDTSVFTIDEDGVLTPEVNSLGKTASVRVTATLKNQVDGGGNVIVPNSPDEIEVGKVTLSENETLNLTEQEIIDKVTNGYEPRGVINNRITSIDIETKDIVLTATFFDNKNRDLQNPVLTWETSNSNIIEIDNAGKLTPITRGNAVINVSTVIDGNNVVAETLEITVADDTVIEEQPEPIDNETILGSGELMSNSFYDVKGRFRIVEKDGITSIILSDDFATDFLPDLVIYLSNNTNSNTGAQIISDEIRASGGQTFVVPNGVDVGRYSNVLLYCRRFSQRVGFGVINR